MSKFDMAVQKVLEHEGGYVDHPLDTGGATNHGITQRVYEQFVGRSVSKNEIMSMPVSHAKQIYKTKYWDKISGDKIKFYTIAFAIFDNAVNRGPHRAINQARSILGQASIPFTEEGAYMPSDTLQLLNSVDEVSFLTSFFNASEQTYKSIVRNNPSQKVFEKGWSKRVNDNRLYTGINTGIINATSIGIGLAVIVLGVAGFFFYRQMKKTLSSVPVMANSRAKRYKKRSLKTLATKPKQYIPRENIAKSNNLKQLEQIKEQGYRGLDGKDYGDVAYAVDDRINYLIKIKDEKEAKKLEKMAEEYWEHREDDSDIPF